MEFSIQPAAGQQPDRGLRRESFFSFAALLVVLLVGMFFRLTGLMWGEYEYQHPDERFLVWVVADIAPVETPSAYFDTRTSSLNPANRGHPFYVYGDLPVIATRYLAESLFEQVGWQEILQTGRGLSALVDLLTVLLVFLIAERLFGWRIALLAGLFNAAAVLQIQQSHFFTVDTFANFFTTLAVYLAVLIATETVPVVSRRMLGLGLFFGAAVGLAMASKLNTFPVAGLLPLALFLRWLRHSAGERRRLVLAVAGIAAASGVVAFLVFRVAQPYAFSGPGFLNMLPDEAWMQSIREQRAQSTGDIDFPPALQWARRPIWFSFQNLVLFGLGLPLGVLAWVGFLVMGVVLARCAIRSWREPDGPLACLATFPGSLVLWGWTLFYFTWQSLAWNATMRYQLPIYPTLSILAGWVLGYAWGRPLPRFNRPRVWKALVAAAGALVLVLTLAWAFAFSQMYTRTETRVAASRWIIENVPGPVNLEIDANGKTVRQLLPLPDQGIIRPGVPYSVLFDSHQSASLGAVRLGRIQVSSTTGPVRLQASLFEQGGSGQPIAAGFIDLPSSGAFDNVDLPFDVFPLLQPGRRYSLSLELAGPGANQGGEGTSRGAGVTLTGQLQLSLYARAQQIMYLKSSRGLFPLRLDSAGTLRQARLPEAGLDALQFPGGLNIIIIDPQTGIQQMATAAADPQAGGTILKVNPALSLKAGITYQVDIGPAYPGQAMPENVSVLLDFLDEPATQLLPASSQLARQDDPLWVQFTPRQGGLLRQVTLAHAARMDVAPGGAETLLLTLSNQGAGGVVLAQVRSSGSLTAGRDPRGDALVFTFDPPLDLNPAVTYAMMLAPDGPGAVAIRGSAPANESTWDMGLPFRLDGYDPYGGIYRNDLNFEMYWPDDADKLQRFLNNLDQSDYIFISSNRQWGTTVRVPERYPLTTAFYRALLGCPENGDILWCYNTAEVEDYAGRLGFDLVQVFTSYPRIGPVEINTQFAEEAFTVYDHPKVFIFQKRADYDPARVREILGSVDLARAVHITPRKSSDFKDMLLPAWMWMEQQAGGTWAQLFPPGGLQNRYPALALVIWYAFLFVLGLLVYPIVRLALPGLPDRGYPLARVVGLVLLAYFAWLAGSLGVHITRLALLVIFAVLAAAGLYLGFLQRGELRREWSARRGYFLRVELLALGFFALQLLIRLGNPDLWHPIFGGEKPMNFSFFNAVLKSTIFPPYDPWFAGGTLNYYYYGYVLVGMPVKLLGITPSVAYNLVLPALFCLVALAAFSIGWNLYQSAAGRTSAYGQAPAYGQATAAPGRWTVSPYHVGLAAAVALLILGNLGTVRMYWQGFQRLSVPEEIRTQGGLVDQVTWAVGGVGKLMSGEAQSLPYYLGDWYWKPSRAIQPETGSEITEFPFFTFLYADLHAHLMALPVTLLVIAWSISVVLVCGGWGSGAGRLRGTSLVLALLVGALAAGALRPANTWDQYTYLPFAAIALGYGQAIAPAKSAGRRWLRVGLSVLALVAFSLLLYQPFDRWYGQAYNQLQAWQGEKTNLASYLVHWGLFLFVIAAWLFDEMVDWMAQTPLSSLSRLRQYREAVWAVAAVVIVALALLLVSEVVIALIVVPLGVLTTSLLFRPGQPLAKRAVLFMVGTALALTLAVELVAVKGDIARMNTVFKFYFQAWSLFALSAAAAAAWLWGKLPGWGAGWRRGWLAALALLVFGAGLFPVTSTQARLLDRMTPNAPHSLDGMAYLTNTRYSDGPTPETYQEMDLNEDYRAIRWVQQNVPGSPVIVEANTPEYRHWGSRFTIYTGLPGVVGWNWHERQQRALTPDTWVYSRIDAIQAFFNTTDRSQAQAFLDRYNVGYIILGQLERIYYEGRGINKFAQFDGDLWDSVYQDGQTVIYKVR